MFQTVLATGCFVASALVLASLNHIGSRSWRHSAGMHWTERARRLYPVRSSAKMNLFFASAAGALAALLLTPEHRNWWPFYALLSFCGALAGCFPLDRKILPEFTFRTWLGQALLSWGTILLLYGPLLAAALLMPREWNREALLISLAAALWHFWSATSGFILILRWVRVLRPIDPRIVDLSSCFDRAQVHPRGVLLLRSPLAVAYAIPFRGELIFSSGLLEKCSSAEVNAICLHELAHLRENRRTRYGRAVSSFLLFPFIFLRPCLAMWGLAGLLPIYCLFFGLLLLCRGVLRKGEESADRFAAASEFDEGEYARALMRLYELNQIPAVMPRKRQIHPDLYDRMLAAGVTPDFARPKKPSEVNGTVLIPVAVAIVLFGWSLLSRPQF